MATKFTLTPNPTFMVTAIIPRAGEEDGKVLFTFKHKRRSEIEMLEKDLREGMSADHEAKKAGTSSMVKFIMDIATDWDLEDAFNIENVTEMLENYPRAFDAISLAFTRELMAIREKN